MVSLLLTTALVAAIGISGTHGNPTHTQWNANLQETCGTNMNKFFEKPHTRKVLNGTAAHFNEAPWSIGVYIPDYKNETVYTTGTLISDHHVITYDWIFLTNDTKDIRFRFDLSRIPDWTCASGKDLLLPTGLTRQTRVFADLLHADKFSGRNELQVKRVVIINGCVQPRTANRIAVITLKKPITKDVALARPICLGAAHDVANDGKFRHPAYTFYGFGDNRGAVKDATLRRTTVFVRDCEFPSDEKFCVESAEPLCNGDFGGAAVKRIDGAVVAFGMYVDGPYDCSRAKKDTRYTFVNLTRVAESICDQSDVCPFYIPRTPKGTPLPPATTGPSTGGGTNGPVGKPATTEGPGPHGDGETDGRPTTRGPTISGGETTDDGSTGGPEGDSTDGPITDGGNPGGREGGSIDGPLTTDDGRTGPPVTTVQQTTGQPGGDFTIGPMTTGNGTAGAPNPAHVSLKCYLETDDDIHIQIKLGKYRETGNSDDIEVIRRRPTNVIRSRPGKVLKKL